jgi:hypothetical protein
MMNMNTRPSARTAALLVLGVMLFTLVPATGFAQSKVGTTAAPFLTIGVGARPVSMGGAFVAMNDDAYALYWNPASLAMLPQSEILMQHSTWLADMSYDFIGAAFSMGLNGTLGFSATMLNVGEMEVTTDAYQEGTGLKFDSYSLAAALSYSYRFYDRFSIGGNFKYIRETIWNESASGFAIDLGTLLITPIKDIRLGMSISNFGTKMQMTGRDLLFLNDPDTDITGNNPDIPASYDTDSWKLPLMMRLGLAGELIKSAGNRITIAADWVVPNDNSESLNLGAEYAFREMFMLRGGMKGIRPGSYDGSYGLFEPDNNGGYTFGAGFLFNLGGFRLRADYGYETFDRLGNVHKYSLGIKF